MELLGKGNQNAVFTDGRYLYRLAYVQIPFPRFCLQSDYHNSYTPYFDQQIIDQCQQISNLSLHSLTRKIYINCPKWVILKPKCPSLYLGIQLFDYTKKFKNITAHDSLQLLTHLSLNQDTSNQLNLMGRYLQLIDCDHIEANLLLHNVQVMKIAKLLLNFYSFYNTFNITLTEFEHYVKSDVYEPFFYQTQHLVSQILNNEEIIIDNTIQSRQILFQAMKSIGDASLLVSDSSVELIDIEMKCMKNKWETWSKVYSII